MRQYLIDLVDETPDDVLVELRNYIDKVLQQRSVPTQYVLSGEPISKELFESVLTEFKNRGVITEGVSLDNTNCVDIITERCHSQFLYAVYTEYSMAGRKDTKYDAFLRAVNLNSNILENNPFMRQFVKESKK